MRVLLPPSETKKSGGGNSRLNTQKLSFNTELHETRQTVKASLERLSTDQEAAKKALKVGPKAATEILNNLTLGKQGTISAIERYTGVLFDAIAVTDLNSDAIKWLESHVLIQSALFGLIRAGDQIPSYRISASSRLADLEAPLKTTWRSAHKNINFKNKFVLDLRSKDYAALAPFTDVYTLEVNTRNADGTMRALNHFNKAAKGDLVHKLAATNAKCDTVDDFLNWSSDNNLDISLKDQTLLLVTELGAPKSA